MSFLPQLFNFRKGTVATKKGSLSELFGSRVGSQTGTHATHPFPSWPGPLHSIKWFLPSASVNTSSGTLVYVWVTFFGGITIWNYSINLSQQLGLLLLWCHKTSPQNPYSCLTRGFRRKTVFQEQTRTKVEKDVWQTEWNFTNQVIPALKSHLIKKTDE